MLNKKTRIGLLHLLLIVVALPSISASNMTLNDLIDSFNYSYSNGSIDIATFQDQMRDSDGNSQNDTLIINLTSGILTDGTYTFIVSLQDGGKIRINSTTKVLSASDKSAKVNFPTELLEASRFNYTLEILNHNSELVFRTNKIQTESYANYEAGLSLLSLTDQNIANTYLNISLQISSARNRTDNITISLSYNSSSISASREVQLKNGTYFYGVSFDNETLKSTHYSSNLTIDSVVIGGKVFDTNKNTSVHSYQDFAKTSYTESAQDSQIDQDGNNLSEFLDLTFNVMITGANTYTLSYDLYDEFGNFIANISKTQALSAGAQTIQTLINGSEIYKTKINGPYVVSFASLASGGIAQDLLLDAHKTGEVFYTDFERPPLPDLALNLSVEFNETTNITNLTITLSNEGSAPAFNIFLDIFDNTSYQNNRSLAFMEAGEQITYKFNLTNSQNATLYTIIADFDNLVDEEDEANNILQNIEAQASVVSLTIDSITELYINGTERTFEFIINNDGTSEVQNISWQFNAGDGTLINSTQNISSLNAGEKAFIYLTHNYTEDGSYEVSASAVGLLNITASLSASVNVGDLILSLSASNPEEKLVLFDYALTNTQDNQTGEMNFAFQTEQTQINSTSSFSLGANETIFGIIGYNYTAFGQKNATLAIATLSKNASILLVAPTPLNLHSLSLLSSNGTSASFGFTILNNHSANIQNANWALSTGEEAIHSAQPFNLTINETLFIITANNYQNSGQYQITANTSQDAFFDEETIQIALIGLEVQSIAILNESGPRRVFEIILNNSLENTLEAVSWSLDTKNSNVINSTSLISLVPNEKLLLYLDYNFTTSGTFNVNATARNGTLSDSSQLSVQIT